VSRRLAPGLLAVLLTVVSAAPVGAGDLEDELAEVASQVDAVSSQISAADAERSALASEVIATKSTLDGLLVELNRTRAELTVLREDLVTQQNLLTDVRTQLAELYLDLAATRQLIEAGEESAQDWARQLYMNAGQDETYLALSAGDLGAITVGLEYLDRISEQTDRALLQYEALRQTEERQAELVSAREEDLSSEVENLQAIEQDLAGLEAQQTEQQAAVESELAYQRELLSTVESEIAHFEGELASLEAEQGRIESAIKAELAKRAAGGDGDGDAATAGGGGGSTGQFVRPVPGAITSSFGPRSHPILGYVRMHTGLDFRAPHGQAIAAAAGGTVILAGTYGGYGNAVVIDHGGGVATLYAHQSSIAVGYGASVNAGDTIGYVGSTGLSTGPHLHFEVRLNGSPVDPVPYL
jgi:murein DD-endopeptidase MepM/ murein hydrolase activator NlpD